MVTKRRSPNYPGITLEEAVEVIGTLYQGSPPGHGVGRGQFTPQDAAQAWGYGSTSGPVKLRLGALRQYGFLEGKKGDNPSLSSRALTLILRERASRQHRQALQQAVLAPPTFAELHERLPGAAQDALRQFLIVDRNFTHDGANRLIGVYEASLAYAELDEYDNMAGQNGEVVEEESHIEEDEREPPMPDKLVFSLSGGTTALHLETALPLSENKWKQLVAMMDAAKDDFVQQEPRREPESQQEPNGGAEESHP